jgi:hypothetical protein
VRSEVSDNLCPGQLLPIASLVLCGVKNHQGNCYRTAAVVIAPEVAAVDEKLPSQSLGEIDLFHGVF